jgi:hypothetical protein
MWTRPACSASGRPSNRWDIAAAYKTLCAFNELQVTLVKRMRRLVAAQQELLPPATFMEQLFREAKNAGIGSELASALQRCLPADS